MNHEESTDHREAKNISSLSEAGCTFDPVAGVDLFHPWLSGHRSLESETGIWRVDTVHNANRGFSGTV